MGRDPARRAERLFLRLMSAEATPADWDEHQRLLADSPDYRRSFEACEAAWDGLDGLDPATLRDPPASDTATARPARVWAAAAMVVLALAAGFIGLRDDNATGPLRFTTGVNEHRTVNLADGSRLVIGARTQVQVRYSAQTRLVKLAGGQVLAEVAPDTARPFIVSTDDAQVVATGTAFDVRDGAAYSTISVVEGSVRVVATPAGRNSSLPAETFAGGTTLQSGQQLRALRGRPAAAVRQVDIGQVTAWQRGQLYFHEDELRTVFEQVMRYSDVSFRVLDPAIGERLYSGSFRPDRLDSWLDAIESAYDLRVTRHGTDWIAVAPADEEYRDGQ